MYGHAVNACVCIWNMAILCMLFSVWQWNPEALKGRCVLTMWACTVNKANNSARLHLIGCVSFIMREKKQPVQNSLQLQGDCLAHILYKCPTQCLPLSCTMQQTSNLTSSMATNSPWSILIIFSGKSSKPLYRIRSLSYLLYLYIYLFLKKKKKKPVNYTEVILMHLKPYSF